MYFLDDSNGLIYITSNKLIKCVTVLLQTGNYDLLCT